MKKTACAVAVAAALLAPPALAGTYFSIGGGSFELHIDSPGSSFSYRKHRRHAPIYDTGHYRPRRYSSHRHVHRHRVCEHDLVYQEVYDYHSGCWVTEPRIVKRCYRY